MTVVHELSLGSGVWVAWTFLFDLIGGPRAGRRMSDVPLEKPTYLLERPLALSRERERESLFGARRRSPPASSYYDSSSNIILQ